MSESTSRKYPRLSELQEAQYWLSQYILSHERHAYLSKVEQILNQEIGRTRGYSLGPAPDKEPTTQNAQKGPAIDQAQSTLTIGPTGHIDVRPLQTMVEGPPAIDHTEPQKDRPHD